MQRLHLGKRGWAGQDRPLGDETPFAVQPPLQQTIAIKGADLFGLGVVDDGPPDGVAIHLGQQGGPVARQGEGNSWRSPDADIGVEDRDTRLEVESIHGSHSAKRSCITRLHA